MANVRLENVTKSFCKKNVFENLNLTINDGECFTLLGPSGCGKTVLLRLIAGFEQPDEGKIYIGDTLVSDPKKGIYIPPESRKIGVVFQDYAVWPHKTVFDNVIYPLNIQKIPKDRAIERAMKALKQVNLDSLKDRYPYQLSGGQQQRVALARALVSGPSIMLLDEPLCNLDANLREEMRFEIKELQKNTGVTILYVTQDLEVALAISDRIAILNKKGEIQQVGSADDTYENPTNPFVFKFMGVSNFVPVQINNNKAYITNSTMSMDFPTLANPRAERDLVAACRPSDIEISSSTDAVIKGIITRKVFLGPIIDYQIQLGDTKVRAQVDTQKALEQNILLEEGSTCSLTFSNLKWYDRYSMESLREFDNTEARRDNN
jgi:iron(III) transport system ATP-binding protein